MAKVKGIRAIDLIAAGVLVAFSFLGSKFSGVWDWDLWLTITLLVAPLTRKRWPLPTFVVLVGILVVCSLRTEITIACILVAGLAAYIVRRDLLHPSRTIATVIFLLGDIIGLFAFAPGLVDEDVFKKFIYVTWSVTLLVACGLMGELRRRTLEAQEHALEQSLAAQREEFEKLAIAQRSHIAREIHDLVTHSLTVIVAQADGGRYAGCEEAKEEALASISKVGRESLQQMRSVVTFLREGEGHAASPSIGLTDIAGLVQQTVRSGLAVSYRVTGEPQPVSDSTSLAMYRIVQEALTNAKNHGTGTAELEIEWKPDAVTMKIQNPCLDRAQGIGLGVNGMRERAELSGGRCTAGPQGNNWQVLATFPLGAHA
ncbi:sensor histidine kinase [Corynebacterium epidermidicanis]|uniref:histidine kinase n=1 Tax=Corynebacterium epidermidicanis TaxID=1050174 RepID=A0A0G3GSX4_9CORY|nr:histidine kinase [Corynebacterium epidermidicanis]AKK01967.1 signal transduction histidine kinase [Corynebacterium epidermidicanis]